MAGRGVGRIVKRVFKMVPTRTGKKVRRYVGIDAKGRWKFLKTPGKDRGRAPSISKRGGKVAEKKRRKRKFSILSAVALAGHLFATTGEQYKDSPLAYAAQGKWNDVGESYIRNLTGYGWWAGVWRLEWLLRGWTPTIIALLAKKVVGWLGLNRYFRDLPINL